MKFTAVILIWVTMLLVLKPGAGLSLYEREAAGVCCDNISCEKEMEARVPAGEEDCCGDFCNPFQMCCSHIVFYPSVDLLAVNEEHKETEKAYRYPVVTVHSNYASDFWQPPRLV